MISPLHVSPDVTPKDSVSQIDSVKSRPSRTSSSSSKRTKEARMKAVTASLKAKQLAERVKRDNEVREENLERK